MSQSVPRAKSYPMVLHCVLLGLFQHALLGLHRLCWLVPTTPNPAPWAPLIASQVMARTLVGTHPYGAGDLGAIHGDMAIMWQSHNHTPPMPPCQKTWVLRVPTLVLFHLFPSYCKLILLWLLCSHCACTCSHSQLGAQLYAPLCHVHTPISFLPMQTAAVVTDTLWPLSQ